MMLIAAGLFVALLFVGLALGELDWRGILGFLVTAGVLLGLVLILDWSITWYLATICILDIVLILWVFKGDLWITPR